MANMTGDAVRITINSLFAVCKWQVSALNLLLILLLCPFLSQAKEQKLSHGIRKVVHSDGTVEYTNVSSKTKKNVVYTSDKSSKVSKIYKYKSADGGLAFSDKSPEGVDYEVIKVKCFACDPESKVNWQKTRLNTSAFSSYILTAAKSSGVEPALIRALIHAESGFNSKAISSQGAQGLMQLMPATAKELGVNDAMNAEQNIHGGATYIARMLKLFDGDIRLAAAAYNAGPGAVKKYSGIPPYKETKTYVKRVGILHQRYKKALSL